MIAITEAIELIKTFEGFSGQAYRCPAGTWTIGYGTTKTPGDILVKPGDTCTAEQAEYWLGLDVQKIARILANTLKDWRVYHELMQAALISFSYNLGPRWFDQHGFATLTANIYQRNWERVPETLKLYRNPGSEFEAGLLRRREAEGKLWASGLANLLAGV